MVKLSGIVENCHLKSQILSIFFQILHIKFTNWRIFFCRGQEYYIDLKMHTKSHSIAICISERKKIILETSILYQNKCTKTMGQSLPAYAGSAGGSKLPTGPCRRIVHSQMFKTEGQNSYTASFFPEKIRRRIVFYRGKRSFLS